MWMVQNDLLTCTGITLKRIKLFLVLLLKYDRKRRVSTIFNPICCNNFSKVSLDFKKMANYFRKVLHTHPDIAMYFLCDRIYRLWEAVKREVLLNYWGYLWKLSWMKFILFLICIASPTYPRSPDMPFLSPDDSFAPSQAEQSQKSPLNK